MKKVRRVVLKLSGEALKGAGSEDLSVKALEAVASEIKKIRSRGIQVAIVIGGGNIWRGAAESGKRGIDRVTADYMGMLATIINALALQDTLERNSLPSRVLSAIEIAKVAEPYIRRRAVRHLEKGRVVIFAGGTGNPYLTTDTTAAMRAAEIGADVVLKATKVDGVYTADPVRNPRARKFTRLSFAEALRRGLKVIDATALSLCQENLIPVRVFNMTRPGNISRAAFGEPIGTLVEA